MELVRGQDARAYCAPPGRRPFDEARLRDVLGQLAEGLGYLHARGRLHRDVKPSNVMVEHGGRVVLLDFGLVVELGAEGERTESGVAGTPCYMAPEQAGGDPIGPAADWYAVGVMLYQALTGVLPFEGGAVEVLGKKLTADPLPPEARVAGLPEDLSRLCMDLLQRDPARRPSGEEVRARLRSGPPRAEPQPGEKSAVFVGRGEQLAALRGAFEAACAGSTAAVLVEGRSGMGKSALLGRFADEARRSEPGSVVLAGRCFEQESVPYKALDNLIDALARHLQRMAEAEVQAVLPRDVATLSRLFPVLGRVPAVASAPRRAEVAGPLALRTRAFAALRELFARLGDRVPLLLLVDDLQWGDADGGALLADLLRPPDAPAMVVVLAYRGDDAEESECLRALLPALGAARGPGLSVTELEVRELGEDDARALALAEIGGRTPTDDLEARATDLEARVAAIVREAGGWPFFLCELCRAEGGHGGEGASLERMLSARARALPEAARRLLEAVAVAGRPIDRALAVQAAALGDEGPSALGLLRRQRLLRARGTGDEIEPYHDRIRETVVADLDPSAKRAYHLALARALQDGSRRADEETLAVHFEGAGERAEAAEHAVRAADQAMDALGFDRATRLYRQAIAALDEGDERWRLLHEKLGAALGNTGHGPEAAAAYLIAVGGAEGHRALELRRRAAEHYLMSGHVEEGLAVLGAVLAATRLSMPATPLRAALRLLPIVVFLWIRGLRFRERAEEDVPPAELLRIDTCASVSFSMIAVDASAALYFQKRFLMLALRAGEPYRVMRALIVELGLAAAQGGDAPSPSVRRLDRVTAALIARLRRSGARFATFEGTVEMMGGVTAIFGGRYREARGRFERALVCFEAGAVQIVGEVALTSMLLVQALYALGEWKEAVRRRAAFLGEARARGDLWLEIELGKMGYLPALMDDLPDAAREALDRVESLWSRAHQAQRFTLGGGYVVTALYREGGAGAGALEIIRVIWPAAVRSGVLPLSRPMRVGLHHLRGHAQLAAAAAAAGAHRSALLRAVDRDARALQGTRTRVGGAYGAALRAGAAACRGDRDRARALLVETLAALEEADLSMEAAAVRRRLGGLTGGEEGRALVEAADAFMSSQGIRSPARMAATLLPGSW
jgi:hypothetical protein